MYCYVVTNIVNGKKYVGITTRTVAARWNEHLTEKRQIGRALTKAIQKYGAAAFTVETVASATTWDELMNREREVIAREGSLSPGGYNLTTGGDGLYTRSTETRARISLAKKGIKPSAETRTKLSAAHKGRVRSPRHCAALSAALKGKPKPAAARAAMSVAAKKKRLTSAHRANIARAGMGRTASAETRAKRSASLIGARNPMFGKRASPELRAKLSAIHLARQARLREDRAANGCGNCLGCG